MAGKLRPFPLRRGVGGSAVQVVNPQYDYVPPHLIDLFVTEYHIEERTDDGTPTYSWSELIPLCPGVNTPKIICRATSALQ